MRRQSEGSSYVCLAFLRKNLCFREEVCVFACVHACVHVCAHVFVHVCTYIWGRSIFYAKELSVW